MQEPATLRARFDSTLSEGSHPNFHILRKRDAQLTDKPRRRELEQYLTIQLLLYGALDQPCSETTLGAPVDYLRTAGLFPPQAQVVAALPATQIPMHFDFASAPCLTALVASS